MAFPNFPYGGPFGAPFPVSTAVVQTPFGFTVVPVVTAAAPVYYGAAVMIPPPMLYQAASPSRSPYSGSHKCDCPGCPIQGLAPSRNHCGAACALRQCGH